MSIRGNIVLIQVVPLNKNNQFNILISINSLLWEGLLLSLFPLDIEEV